jgi:RHS repeat-associated protein
MRTGIFGNGVQQTMGVNTRQQMNAITQASTAQTLFSKTYSLYDASNKNNGNILNVFDGLNSAHNQSYSYDSLNRIATGSQTDGTFNIAFNYDPWGNMSESGTSNFQPLFDVHNRIATSVYDSAGNLLNDGFHTYTYDAEGRMKNMDTGVTYTYSAGGSRIRKDAGAAATEFVYFGDGVIAEKNVATGVWTDYILAYDSRVAMDNSANASGAQYFHTDQIASTRLVTNSTGAIVWQADYNPFGQELNSQNNSIRFQFAGMEYDSESNLNHTEFRQYASAEGRWLSPDPDSGSIDLGNPQSFNRFVYALNNPMILGDPSGLDCIYMPDAAKDSNLLGPGILRGDCLSDTDGGVFVNGTIDVNSLSYDPGRGTLHYTYSNDDTHNFGVGRLDMEGGEGAGKPEAPSYGDCVKEMGKFFSLQNAAASVFNAPGINDNWIAGALGGNPYSDAIEMYQDLTEENYSGAIFDGTMAVFDKSQIADHGLEHLGVKLISKTVIKILNPPGNAQQRRMARRAGRIIKNVTTPYSKVGRMAKAGAGSLKALNLWNDAVSLNSLWMCGIGR